MYIRSNVSGSIETENRLLSEMSDTTVFKVGNSGMLESGFVEKKIKKKIF